MAGIFSTWLIPGIVTVSGGTALAVILTGASMSSDLGSWATAALSAPEHSWTHVEIEGREAILSGIATSQPMIDAAITRLAEVHGLQGIQSAVTLAEFVSPFPFTASLSQGRIILTGGFPDEASHTAIVATAENAVDQLRLLSGGPDSALFRAGASYGIRSLGELDQGSARLADLSLTIEGRAKSPEAFAAIEKLRSSVPPGIRLAALTVTPALASPFTWTAEFDGNSVSIGGHTERPDLTAKLRAAAAGVAVKTELTLASGSPIGFDANTLILLKALLQLERGHASISDQRIELTGAPATAEIGLAVTAAVTGIGGTAKLEPPRIANFAFTATKADDGVSYRGFVPDDATRDRLAAADGANVSSLQLGRGAPSGFAEALDFGLAALAHVSEGEFAINDTSLTLTGRANALVDLAEIDALTASDIPVGMRLRLINIRPPLA
ncbi:MAG: hypothetical protein ABIO40_05745, partial [Devosia sp.]